MTVISAATSNTMSTKQSNVRRTAPLVLYIGDPPPEETFETPSLLFRTLQAFPASEIAVCYRKDYPRRGGPRLDGVMYHEYLGPSAPMVFPTRFGVKALARLLSARFSVPRKLRRLANSLAPSTIVTVAHGLGCLTATNLARSLDVPLHLIIHDDWSEYSAGLSPRLRRLADMMFGYVYRSATHRWAISDYMAEEMRLRFKRESDVLYPIRPRNAHAWEKKSEPRRTSTGPIVVYAGTVWGAYSDSIEMLAASVASSNGNVLVYTDTRHAAAECGRLAMSPNIEIRNAVPVERLVTELRGCADILFLPMSFAPDSHRLSFPSKLTVYTMTGLPIIVFGGPDCSAAKWACAYPGTAVVVSSRDEKALSDAVGELWKDPDRRVHIGHRASIVGDALFDWESNSARFAKMVRNGDN